MGVAPAARPPRHTRRPAVPSASPVPETGTEDLLLRVEDRVAILTMNRPDRRNALSPEMVGGLKRVLPELARDPGIGCVVLTGAGRAFCAGGDVKAMNRRNESGGRPGSMETAIQSLRDDQRGTSGALREMGKPTLAAIPGPAAGAGFSLALSCDLRIAAESAFFTTAFARVGFSGDYGGSYFLTNLIGPARAREMYFLADRVDAKEAERLGIVNRVVPDAALEEEALKLAKRLAAGPTIAYRYMKENLNRALQSDARTCLDAEAVGMIRTGGTEDHREAVRAFLDKREPEFKGR
jgi:2-(1,2-epoxy-1,2-dihydrophenyl)acetyl-CoA isomerase